MFGFGKKKPWEYTSDVDKMMSIANDFPNDKKVLRKVLKEDDSIEVKSVALLSLIAIEDDLSFDPFKLIKYMLDLGLSEDVASSVIISIAQHIEKTKD